MTTAEGVRQPTTDESRLLLRQFGIATPREAVAGSAEEVLTAATEFDGPLVLKAVAPDLVHKSDVGGVVVGIENAQRAYDEACRMARRVPDITGFVLQEFVEGAHELVVGLRRDPVLGAFVVVGLGGIWVEVLDDVAIHSVPCTHADAETMLAGLRAAPMLAGARGGEPLDRQVVADVVVALSTLAQHHPKSIRSTSTP